MPRETVGLEEVAKVWRLSYRGFREGIPTLRGVGCYAPVAR